MRNTKWRGIATALASFSMVATGLSFAAPALANEPCGADVIRMCRVYWQQLGYQSMEECVDDSTFCPDPSPDPSRAVIGFGDLSFIEL